MVNPAPYSKKGERWVNHTVAPGSYVVSDPRPPPPPPPYSKPTGQTWARPNANNRPPLSKPPVIPPNPYAIAPHPGPPSSQAGPPPGPPPPMPIPQAFQTPKGKTPRFYDPDDFRKFTEAYSGTSSASHMPTYSTPVSVDSSGRTFLPVVGDTQKRGPYSERLTRAEETELLKTCMALKETFGAPSTQNKWWLVCAAAFSVYRRKQGRSDLQAPTAKRRVEFAIAKRKKEVEEDKESDEPPEYVAALNEWLEHTEKLEKGDIQPLSSKQAAEAKLDEELERIKKEKEIAERENPLPTPPPSSSTPTLGGPRSEAGQSAQTPVVVSDSPPPNIQNPSHHSHPRFQPPLGGFPYPTYAPPPGPMTHHHHVPPPPFDPRPAKRQRTDDGPNHVADKTASALDIMTKLANAMFESQQNERKAADQKSEPPTTQEADAQAANGSTDSLFSPASTGGNEAAHRLEEMEKKLDGLDELEKKLDEQKEANTALQSKMDEMTSTLAKFTEEAAAAETREKDRDKKMDKILQVLKKHFAGTGAQGAA